ncbi:hypothetical protein [Pedobacter gandavensis]|uniref:hypothetical protein n=1 Tax=Pedobacter gandavensis TaxID=2679963 RepID=UPI00292E3640|nr:hypothetical protein [Pedobacter gandavensis]
MKNSTNDPFDLDNCIRGLSILMSSVHSDFYEFVYYLTFKKEFREYYSEFNNPWESPIEDGVFFEDVTDPCVQNCLKAFTIIGQARAELDSWFGFSYGEDEELRMATYEIEGLRFKPFQVFFKRSKSYKKLKLSYERSLAEFIHSMFLYSCALTAQSNKIPLLLKRQFKLTNDDAYRLLNHDDHQVVLLIGLMKGLKKLLNELRLEIYTPVMPVRKPQSRSKVDSKNTDNSKK